MVRLGVHISIAGGLDKAIDRAKAKECDLFQIFSCNPRGWRSKPLLEEDAERFRAKFKKSGLDLAVDHMPYLPNLASPRGDVFAKSVEALASELTRCKMLGIPYLVTHLGSHLGAGREQGFRRITSSLETAFSRAKNDVVVLLENTSDEEQHGRIFPGYCHHHRILKRAAVGRLPGHMSSLRCRV